MRNFTIHIILSFFFGLLFSCNDEEPVPIYADVSILSPAKYAEFDVLDTIMINLKIEGAGRTADVTANLNNGSGIPVLPAVNMKNAATDSEINMPFIISDSTLPGGLYNLFVRIFSNGATTGQNIPVYVNERSKKLLGIWIVTRKNSSGLEIVVLNPDFETITLFSKPGDYAGSDLSSETQLFAIAGSHSGDLVSYHTNDFDEAWRIPCIPNPNQPYFTLVHFDDEELLAGFWEGFISRYNQSGQIVYSSENAGATIPEFVLPTGNFLVSATTQRSNVNQKWLYVNYRESGALLTTTAVDFRPYGFSPATAEKVLIFGNDKNDLISTWLYDPQSGHISRPYEPFDLPEEPLILSEYISGSETLMVTENALYQYDFEKSVNLLFEFNNAGILHYESVNGLIWLAKQNQLTVMDYNGNTVGIIGMDTEILNFHFHYNK